MVLINNITALFTAARQYCLDHPYSTPIDEVNEWLYHFGGALKAPGEGFSFPDTWRQNDEVSHMFGDLLFEIEHVMPDDFLSLDDLRIFLCASSQTIYERWKQSEQTGVNENTHEQVTAACTSFQHYIATITLEQLSDVGPLPFRHYMSQKERERLWYRLRRKWNVAGKYWYPIAPTDFPPQPENVIAFQLAWFQQGVPLKTLHEILKRHGIWHVWEFCEHILPSQEDNIIDVVLMAPYLEGETYWSSEKRDWIIYMSHESSLTIGGVWLIEAIKKVWPTWEEHLYKDPFYPRPVIDEAEI